MKIVINSHNKSTIALKHLLESLKEMILIIAILLLLLADIII